MAVQAQYPSNVLFLNRNVQEGKSPLGNDYSLQPQPGGGGGGSFLDQTQMLFNPGAGAKFKKERKRTYKYNGSNKSIDVNAISASTATRDLTQRFTHRLLCGNSHRMLSPPDSV
ncbi:hypothetical protein HAX54_002403 [Datura stramonium]|uniref:Uncharacterized protein n=1 Tax=Datura stramonium TaxID=4076 RepID=A0ABS8T520_DATST|nr:hypothetical protein [Datura stramonium]